MTAGTVLASIHTWALDDPFALVGTIAGTVLLAFLVRWLVHRIIGRTVATFSDNAFARRLARARATHGPRGPLHGEESAEVIAERTAARARTVGALLGSIATFIIFAVAAIVILELVGLDVTPVIASAGVVGIAVGFGAQSLIRDFLTGLFMIFEDQYGVGDVIDTGQAIGTVEDVGLRITKLRDENGVLWYVPNGAIQRIGNKSQGWAVANVEVPVAYSENLERVREMLREAAAALAADPEWEGDVLAEPATCSVESMTPDAVLLRVQVRTQPLRQNEVARELRVRVKDALDAGGVAYKQGPH